MGLLRIEHTRARIELNPIGRVINSVGEGKSCRGPGPLREVRVYSVATCALSILLKEVK